MEQLVASSAFALVLLTLVVRDVLIDQGVAVRATDRTGEALGPDVDEREHRTVTAMADDRAMALAPGAHPPD